MADHTVLFSGYLRSTYYVLHNVPSVCPRKTKQPSKWQVFLACSLVRSLVIGPERKWKTWSLPSLHLYFHLASTYSVSWELEKPDRSPAAFRKFLVCSVVPTLTWQPCQDTGCPLEFRAPRV